MAVTQYLPLLKKYRSDPWAWATDCVFTLDQADTQNSIKPFPKHEYLKTYFDVWMNEPLLAVPKSRRMFLSWATITLYTWDTMFHFGRHNAFVSKKEEDANELVIRSKFILDNLKGPLPKECYPRHETKFLHLNFPDMSSKIQGFPMGPDQIRQYTLSGIMCDEIAFWQYAEDTYSAVIPIIEKGSRFTAISSAAPGFFKRLVFDELDRGR
jgi:hypothetical protein